MPRNNIYNSDDERKNALREQKRLWAYNHREELKKYAKEYYEKNKDEINKKNVIRNRKYKYIRIKINNQG